MKTPVKFGINNGSPSTAKSRRGATLVESAFTLGLFLTLLFGMFDLGMAVMHYNTLSEAAHLVARKAVVRGARAAPKQAMWGPQTWSGAASDDHEIAAAAASVLVAVPRDQVQIVVEWPDGGNSVGDRVSASVTMSYDPVVPFVGGRQGISLSGVSVMRVAH